MRIFIVDDSKLILDRLKENLIPLGKEVEIVGTAATVHDAILGIDQLQPELIILDIKMPDGSGIDVLKDIKKRMAKVKVIMYTHYSSATFEHRCKLLGADYFVDKADFDSLLKIISHDITKST